MTPRDDHMQKQERPMRIAIMCSGPGVGLCPYPVELAICLHHLGQDVHAFCGSDKEIETGLRAKLDLNKLPVHVVPFAEAMGKKGFSPFDSSLRRALDELKPDIVQSWGPRFAYQGRAFWFQKHKPIHVAMIMSMAHDSSSKWHERIGALLANRYLDRVLALCELESQRLSSVGVRADKTQIMLAPMACPPNAEIAAAARAAGRNAVLSEFNLPIDRKYAGCFAQFRAVKRQDQLIQAFEQLANEFPQWDLVLAGAGERFEECKKLAAALGGRVHFLGSIQHERAIRLMTAMTAQAHVSMIETFGYSMLEPLLLGVPTVMTRVGIGKEIESAGKGLVVEAGNLPELTAGLRTVMQQSPPILMMAAQGPEWVTQTFDTPLVAAKLLKLYQRMLAARAR
jgi:glycosyltransferase involved in cell wall biosynthesis